mmetsp:Transcript_4190/g.17789  ORF Transcript_4190/g.17789 Transcript_4190/m.17789 type:complete len:638 (+) Transcript_4190:752-2665(+)
MGRALVPRPDRHSVHGDARARLRAAPPGVGRGVSGAREGARAAGRRLVLPLRALPQAAPAGRDEEGGRGGGRGAEPDAAQHAVGGGGGDGPGPVLKRRVRGGAAVSGTQKIHPSLVGRDGCQQRRGFRDARTLRAAGARHGGVARGMGGLGRAPRFRRHIESKSRRRRPGTRRAREPSERSVFLARAARAAPGAGKRDARHHAHRERAGGGCAHDGIVGTSSGGGCARGRSRRRDASRVQPRRNRSGAGGVAGAPAGGASRVRKAGGLGFLAHAAGHGAHLLRHAVLAPRRAVRVAGRGRARPGGPRRVRRALSPARARARRAGALAFRGESRLSPRFSRREERAFEDFFGFGRRQRVRRFCGFEPCVANCVSHDVCQRRVRETGTDSVLGGAFRAARDGTGGDGARRRRRRRRRRADVRVRGGFLREFRGETPRARRARVRAVPAAVRSDAGVGACVLAVRANRDGRVAALRGDAPAREEDAIGDAPRECIGAFSKRRSGLGVLLGLHDRLGRGGAPVEGFHRREVAAARRRGGRRGIVHLASVEERSRTRSRRLKLRGRALRVRRAAAAAKSRANASPKSSSATTTPPVRSARGARRDALAASRPQQKTSTETPREATVSARVSTYFRAARSSAS